MRVTNSTDPPSFPHLDGTQHRARTTRRAENSGALLAIPVYAGMHRVRGSDPCVTIVEVAERCEYCRLGGQKA
jgi:hypothetical protein